MSDGSDLSGEDVREILRLIDESEFDEFELETPRFSLRVSRREAGTPASPAGTAPAADGGPSVPATSSLVDVAAPMVGTFYRAPAPGEPPFADVGSRVDEGTQLCIIEVMKLMTSVASPARGRVAEVCVENGTAVGFGDVLFRIAADG